MVSSVKLVVYSRVSIEHLFEKSDYCLVIAKIRNDKVAVFETT